LSDADTSELPNPSAGRDTSALPRASDYVVPISSDFLRGIKAFSIMASGQSELMIFRRRRICWCRAVPTPMMAHEQLRHTLLPCAIVCETQTAKSRSAATLVQLIADGSTLTVQLNDPEYFNTFSNQLGDDMRCAVQHICLRPLTLAVVLQAAGPHFSVGGNPYSMRDSIAVTLAGFAVSLREMYDGFLQMRSLLLPVVGAIHGTLVGGGVAGCLHADCLAADHASTFEHGNLVRGVCVLGMLSQTFAVALGQHARHVYLQNARLDATTAQVGGLVHRLCRGVVATQTQAHNIAEIVANVDIVKVMRCPSINLAVLAREAIGHTECQVANGGFSKSLLPAHTSAQAACLDLQPVIEGAAVNHSLSAPPLYFGSADSGAESDAVWQCAEHAAIPGLTRHGGGSGR
jgi:enoyl-CoA hydratase/carnithine racemase